MYSAIRTKQREVFAGCGVCALTLFLVPVAALAGLPDKAALIKTHLEFQGYSVTTTPERLVVTHSSKLNFSVKKFRGGMLLTAFLGMGVQRAERLAALELVNKINVEAGVTRTYIDKDGDLVFEAWTSGYDKTSFSEFLSAWEEDTTGLLMKFLSDLKSFQKQAGRR